MSLNRLELVGFKSFMSPVTLKFGDGITAILGPNGCGKTNVVDAVRWVLGEQSPRQLRSSKMENVIFNGTQVHKPLGYALVNMTVNNERGVFPIDYSEITISRKVYRSGISEYFINKSPCRLKDIRELFADTGTGSHSYAVIEQEMVEYVLNDAHGERRLMFEEASGIVKYRMRREEAARKLKLTEADLLRLDDILEELGKNVRSLRYQVGKTKRYRNIKQRIRDWGLIRSRRTLSRHLKEKREVEAELSKSLEISRRGDDSLDQMEKNVEQRKFEMIEFEKRNTRLQNDRYELRKKIQVSEEKIIQFTERHGEAQRKIERALREVEEAKARLSRIAERIEGVRTEQDVTSERIAAEEDGIRELGGTFEEVSLKIKRLQGELIDMKQTQLDFLQDQVRVKSSQEHYEGVLRELDTRSTQLREGIVALELEVSRLASGMNESRAALQKERDTLTGLEKKREEAVGRSRETESALSESEAALAENRTELARLRSRYDLYSRMKENFEGFPGGARYVLKKNDTRVKGPLAEVLKVEEKYRAALEAVLGGMTDGVVVNDYQGAMDLIAELSSKRLGGIRFFVEDVGAATAGGDPGGVPGMLGRLSSFVDIEGSGRGMVEDLLGDTIVFEKTDQAMEFVSSGAGNGFSAVTLSGVYFCRGRGIYYSGGTGEEITLLGRSEEIEKIGRSIEALHAEVGAEEKSCETRRKEKESLRSLAAELDGRISEARNRLSEKMESFQEIERDHITKKEKCSLLMKSLDELESSRVETMSKLEETKLALAMQKEPADVSRTATIESELAGLAARKAELEGRLTERKVGLASLQGIHNKQAEELRGLGEMEKQFDNILEQREIEIASSREESKNLTGGIEEERIVVKKLLEEETGCQKELEELNGILEEKRASISVMESELKERHDEREKVFAGINDCKVRLSTIDTKMQDLVERALEIYGEDLGCYLKGEEIPLTEEEESVTAEMLEKEKSKLESLGPVNLAAIEEYEEKKERFEFLESQKEDLVNARTELEEAIRKINRRARKRFLETFELVMKFFAEIFEVLFEGGEASLSLGENSDPLEADIIISARPKGKRLQDISLLSGGERALTAMALLFALYKAKPSPFCIFDEVDAPLDDANIQRFVKMLKKFSRETQFIIITHNKRTMEAADTLFGVTMEEKGVSQIVSVDLTQIESVLESRGPAKEELAGSTVTSN